MKFAAVNISTRLVENFKKLKYSQKKFCFQKYIKHIRDQFGVSLTASIVRHVEKNEQPCLSKVVTRKHWTWEVSAFKRFLIGCLKLFLGKRPSLTGTYSYPAITGTLSIPYCNHYECKPKTYLNKEFGVKFWLKWKAERTMKKLEAILTAWLGKNSTQCVRYLD